MQAAEAAGFDCLGLSAGGLPGRAKGIMLAAGVIYSYTRADAIRDGVLIELPDAIVREAGIVFPVAVTDNLWGTYIEPDYLDKLPGQSVNGRLWDLLWMFHLAARRGEGHSDRLSYRCTFTVQRLHPGGVVVIDQETVMIQAVCGPGDHGEPTITLMLPGDD